MPIYKGNTKYGAIYKGTIPYGKIYKGSTLIFESAKWLNYSFNNLYKSTIPSTIDNRQVKNQARITKVYGNGVIQNQLANGISGYSNSNCSLSGGGTTPLTITCNGNGNPRFTLSSNAEQRQNHKYLLVYYVNSPKTLTFSARYSIANPQGHSGNNAFACITTNLANINAHWVEFTGEWQNSDVITLQYAIIDLTQMFGANNEPSIITDNRVKAILDNGYVAYNTGTYEATNISEFSTTKADTTALDTITLKAQLNGALNAHDTMEITKDNVVFTKNIASLDMGLQTWYTASYGFYITLRNAKAVSSLGDVGNIVCKKYITINSSSLNFGGVEGIVIDENNHIQVRDSNYSTTSDFQTAMLGTTLYYELATPQTITIPRKYMKISNFADIIGSGVVMGGSNGAFWIRGFLPNAKTLSSGTPNIFCSEYLTTTTQYLGSMSDMTMTLEVSSSQLLIKDMRFTSVSDLVNYLAQKGLSVFYETNTEVSDIDNQISIEAGGVITSDSDILPNVDLEVKCK